MDPSRAEMHEAEASVETNEKKVRSLICPKQFPYICMYHVYCTCANVHVENDSEIGKG